MLSRRNWQVTMSMWLPASHGLAFQIPWQGLLLSSYLCYPECLLSQSLFQMENIKSWKIWLYRLLPGIFQNNKEQFQNCAWVHLTEASSCTMSLTEHQFATLQCTRDSSQCNSPFQFILCQENEYFLNSRGTISFLMYSVLKMMCHFQTKYKYLNHLLPAPHLYLQKIRYKSKIICGNWKFLRYTLAKILLFNTRNIS